MSCWFDTNSESSCQTNKKIRNCDKRWFCGFALELQIIRLEIVSDSEVSDISRDGILDIGFWHGVNCDDLFIRQTIWRNIDARVAISGFGLAAYVVLDCRANIDRNEGVAHKIGFVFDCQTERERPRPTLRRPLD